MFIVGIVALVAHLFVFTAFVAAGLYVQRRQFRWHPQQPLPPQGISVILPIKGLDPGAREHYRHWLLQEVAGPYEVIFSLQDPADPVLPLLQDLLQEYPAISARVIVNPVRKGLHGKSSNLLYGVETARYPHLVMADSDIAPPPDLVRRLVPPLADPQVGVVGGLPVVRGATNLWGALTAATLNTAITVIWAPMYAMGTAQVASGACFAIRRETLERIGGIAGFGGNVTEDAEMARRVVQAGLRIVMGPAVVLHQGDGTWPAFWGLAIRGGLMNKHFNRLHEQISTLYGNFAPFLVAVAALVAWNPPLLAAAAAELAAIGLVGAILQYGSDPAGPLRWLWVYPVMLAANAAANIRTLWSDRLTWRGLTYRVGRGGRLTLLSNEQK